MPSGPREHRLCPHCDQPVTRVHRTWLDKLALRTSVYWCKACQRRVVPPTTAVKQRERWRRREGMMLGALALVGVVAWFLWVISRPPEAPKPQARRAKVGTARRR